MAITEERATRTERGQIRQGEEGKKLGLAHRPVPRERLTVAGGWLRRGRMGGDGPDRDPLRN